MAVKRLVIIAVAFLFFIPVITHAASATYTNTTSTIEVSDSFSITDLDVTLNLDADIHALDVNLVSPAGTRIGLYTLNRAFGTRFRSTIFDDEATSSLTGSHSSWAGRFRPNQALSGIDGSNAEGTWTLELAYDPAFTTSLPIVLHNWSLTFQGAEPSTISGTKYHDKNGNGQRDDSEEGLSGWTIYIDSNNDTELDSGEPTTTTDSEGKYQFSDVDIKDYILREIFQPGWFQVTPRGNKLSVRTSSGQTAENTDFGNIPESETLASTYTNTTVVPIQNDGTAVRAQSTLNVSDSFPVVDVNVTIDANAPLFDTRFSLIGPDGTKVMLFREGSTGVIGGSQFRSTTFDDQAPETIGSGDRPPFLDTYTPKEFLSAQNQSANGVWTLEALDTNTSNGTTGAILAWTLELRTPIPEEPDEPEPIILVPGMMASLNTRKIFSDFDGGAWDFGPGARSFYQALIDRLESQGFILNENLFISHYDWRNPVSDAATNYLKPAIEKAKQKTGSDKVDIVAHSMGGLVSRAYIQSPGYGGDVDQLITLGTPHLGAVDAYGAWEGGQIPERWDPATRWYLFAVESALKIRRFVPTAPLLDRPTTFRLFFPSLKDLLPISNYVNRDGSPIAVSQHTEKNPFLQRLRDTVSLLNDVEVTTIAGNNLGTLNQVPIKSTRTSEDISRERWRDGHPNPDPPTTDSSAGDQTVLAASALFGTNTISLNNIKHMKLPEEAQEEVLQALGLDATGTHIAYDTPDSFVGTVVLSPVVPSVTLPDGTTFVCDANKQTGNAECIVDEADPNGPKLLVVADPGNGQYKLTFTGTGTGEYHAITCFADNDSDNCSTREAQTKPGQKDIATFVIGSGTYTAPAGDVVALLKQLKDSLFNLLLDKHIKVAGSKLHGIATRLPSFGENYAKEAAKNPMSSKTKDWYKKVQADFKMFNIELQKQIAVGNLDKTAILEITSLRDQLIEAGL